MKMEKREGKRREEEGKEGNRRARYEQYGRDTEER